MDVPAVQSRQRARRSQGARLGIGALAAALVIVASALSAPLAQAAQSGDYVFERQVGSAAVGDQQLMNPYATAVSTAGDVYVIDPGGQRVKRFSARGAYVSAWGSFGSGEGKFNFPAGIAIGADGDVYVADTGNHRVQQFTPAGQFVRQWGTYGIGNGEFNSPAGIAVAPDGTVYVADHENHRIQRFSPSGDFLARWGALGTQRGQFTQPFGIAVAGDGTVYVTELGNRVQRFSSTGEFEAAWGTSGTGPGQFGAPLGIAVDASGDVLVADSENNRVQKFSGSGAFLAQWGAKGSGTQQMDHPIGLTADSSGRVYLTDSFNRRVQVLRPGVAPRFVASPPARAVLGRSYSSQLTASGFPAVGSFVLVSGALPPGLALSASGRISGKPSKTGVFTFALRAGNGVLPMPVKSFTITVGSPAVFTAGLKTRAVVGKKYSSRVKASGFPTVKSFSIVSGKLPRGLKLSASGKVTGTPKKAGRFVVTIRANNTVAPATAKRFTITVKAR